MIFTPVCYTSVYLWCVTGYVHIADENFDVWHVTLSLIMFYFHNTLVSRLTRRFHNISVDNRFINIRMYKDKCELIQRNLHIKGRIRCCVNTERSSSTSRETLLKTRTHTQVLAFDEGYWEDIHQLSSLI